MLYHGGMEPASDPQWLTAEQQRVWRQWLSVQARFPAALNRQLQADSGLSLPDFEVLVHLSEAPQQCLRVTALADQLQWEQSRLSHHLRRMEARGLVRRQACAEDGRGSLVVLSPEGLSRLEGAAPGHVRAVIDLLFDRLDAGQLAALDGITRSILDAIEGRHRSR